MGLRNSSDLSARLTGRDLLDAMRALLASQDVQMAYSQAQQQNDIHVLTLSLDAAAGVGSAGSGLSQSPNVINFPFKNVFVSAASDQNVKVYMKPYSKDSQNNLNSVGTDSMPLQLKDSYQFDFAAAGGVLTWASQPGKIITLVFSLNTKLNTGTITTTSAGSVVVSDGSSTSTSTMGAAGTAATVAVTSAAAIQLCPANSSRKVFTFYNTGGNIRVGDSTVLATTGVQVQSGGSLQFRNTGTLFAIAESASSTVTGNEET